MEADYHGFVAMGIGILFAREALGLAGTLRELYDTREMWSTMRSSCPPVLVLCMVLGTLTVIEVLYTNIANPWAHSMPPTDGYTQAWRPVHTLRYLEWFIDVPCLMTLAGHCALSRPMKEVLGPIFITNAYILLAWGALVAPGAHLKWTLVAASFVGYFWASVLMMRWIWAFLEDDPFDGRGKHMRILVPVTLTVTFLIYGVVYLLSLAGVLDHHKEQFSYTMLAFAAKVVVTATFAYLRWVEDRATLAGLIRKVGATNTSLMTILRSGFDMLVMGSIHEGGSCILNHSMTTDVMELERLLGRPAAGVGFETLLANESSKHQFAKYTENVLRQATEASSAANPMQSLMFDPSNAMLPYMAQVLNCEIQCGVPSKGPVLFAKVHISPVPQSFDSKDCKDVIVAISFAGEAVPNPDPEQMAEVDEADTLQVLWPGHEQRPSVWSSTSTTAGEDKTMSDDDDDEEIELGEEILGGCDVRSQSSKISYVGSVHMACRQLLGPLLDAPPPAQFMSRNVEDHLDVAAELVRLRAPQAITRFHHEQEMADWRERCQNMEVAALLERSVPSACSDERVWTSEVLPKVLGPKPGPKPKRPEGMLDNDGELWERAWHLTYEGDGEDSDEDALKHGAAEAFGDQGRKVD
eukprot:CAMPEP_0178444118 /NCGR_PEP_ID=MMETSP0689_2-20121128/39307_1 /TAXON_ID=160604 /ORGANISM="Amphidinium massartii, Strain CS-259" /LENGTH=637 /DNA_ID=CAMNT_0020068269 /DNA_START=168 /DNA_END=2082 /DNA_ORIENTATION=+